MSRDSRKKKKEKAFGKGRILLIAIVIMAIVFMPTTVFLFIGMLPTIVVLIVDRSKRRTKALTVGSMNLAGCLPFLLDLWVTDSGFSYAMTLIANPRTITVIYSAAGIGYLIDWSVSGVVATIVVQRSVIRLKEIEVRQKELIDQWGREVTGELLLDAYGFPLEPGDSKDVEKAE